MMFDVKWSERRPRATIVIVIAPPHVPYTYNIKHTRTQRTWRVRTSVPNYIQVRLAKPVRFIIRKTFPPPPSEPNYYVY